MAVHVELVPLRNCPSLERDEVWTWDFLIFALNVVAPFLEALNLITLRSNRVRGKEFEYAKGQTSSGVTNAI